MALDTTGSGSTKYNHQSMLLIRSRRTPELEPMTKRTSVFFNEAILVGGSGEDPTEDPTDYSERSLDDWSDVLQPHSITFTPSPPSPRRQKASHRQGSTERHGISSKSEDINCSVQKRYSSRLSCVDQMQSKPMEPKSRTKATEGRSQVSTALYNGSQHIHLGRIREANTKLTSKSIELPFCKEEKGDDLNKTAATTSVTTEEERRKARLLRWNSKFEIPKPQVPQEEKVMIISGRRKDEGMTPNSPEVLAFMAQWKKVHEERVTRAKQRISRELAVTAQQAQARKIRMTAWNAKYEALDASSLEAKLNQTVQQQGESAEQVTAAKAEAIRREKVKKLVRQKSVQQLWIRNEERVQRLDQAKERIRQKEEQERKEAEKRGKHILEWNLMYEGTEKTPTPATN